MVFIQRWCSCEMVVHREWWVAGTRVRLVNRRTAGSGPKSCMVVFCSAASSAARSMHSLGERWHKTALLATSAVQKVAEFFPWPAVNAGVLSTSAHVSSSVHGELSQPATNGARCCSRTAAGRGLSDTAIKGNSMIPRRLVRDAWPPFPGGQSRNTTRHNFWFGSK